MKYLFSSILAGCIVSSSLSATVLIFDEDDSSVIGPSQLATYGDSITAASQGGFNYGSTYGFTPNVGLDFLSSTTTWISGYGDMTNVIYTTAVLFEFTLTAEDGVSVLLHGFDLAGFGGDRTLQSLTITDESDTELYSVTNFLVEGGTDRTTIAFPTALQGESLTVSADMTGAIQLIGFDNIGFGQVGTPIPEPSMFPLVFGLLIYTGFKRRVRIRN
jgi:hypothetical protein